MRWQLTETNRGYVHRFAGAERFVEFYKRSVILRDKDSSTKRALCSAYWLRVCRRIPRAVHAGSVDRKVALRRIGCSGSLHGTARSLSCTAARCTLSGCRRNSPCSWDLCNYRMLPLLRCCVCFKRVFDEKKSWMTKVEDQIQEILIICETK